MRHHKGLMLASIALAPAAAAFLSAQAAAQQISAQQGAATPQPATAEITPSPADIVVTANKREQSLRDVGLTITALSGDQIRQQNVQNLSDLAHTVPNLDFEPTAYATPVFTLRGVGFYDSSLSSYPAVATYVDEVPLAFPSLASHMAFDLQRMEVLKGPQGTLFGASSTGGAINFIANKPTRHFEAGGDLTVGRFNRVEGNAYVSGPLTDTLGVRLAVNAARMDPWQISQTRPDARNGAQRFVTGRLIVDWHPTDTLKFELSGNAFRDTSQPQAPQYKTYIPQRTPTDSPLSGPYASFPFAPGNARVADWDQTIYTNAPGSAFPGHPRGRQTMFEGALRGDWEFVPGITLTSITSAAHYKRNVLTENDGTPYLATDYTLNGTISTFNQEVRIANSGKAPLRWIIGANYEHTNVHENLGDYWQVITLRRPATDLLSGYRSSDDQYLRNYAIFGNAEYDIMSKLTLKGGLRYTETRRRVDECTYDDGDGSYAGLINTLGAQLAAAHGLPFTPISGTQCGEIDDVSINGAPPTFNPGEFHGKLNEHNVSWRVGLDYKLSRQALLYLNVAKGYKAGTYPFIGGTDFKLHTPVKQEALLDYEGGGKFELFDRHLTINAAGFYYKYDNKQLRSRVPDPNFGALNSMIQVPRASLYGAELESSLRLGGLTTSASFTYTHGQIDRYLGYAAVGAPPTPATPPINFDGAVLPYLSKYQTAVSADYEWRLSSLRPFVGATVTYRSSQQSAIGGATGVVALPAFRSEYPLADIFKLPGYALLDLRAGVRGPDDRWSVTIFGKNVLNKYYFINSQPVYDAVVDYTGMPATFGVTLGFKFR